MLPPKPKRSDYNGGLGGGIIWHCDLLDYVCACNEHLIETLKEIAKDGHFTEAERAEKALADIAASESKP